MIYLDYAAATPIDNRVLAKMQPYFGQKFYNPSATYLPAKAVAKDVGHTRTQVAHVLGVRPSEIYFTAGGTEANNLAIHGIMKQFPKGNMVASAVEHESVLEPAKLYNHQIAPVLPDGRLDVEALKKLIDDNTALVSIMYANNEVGTVQPIREVAQIIEEIKQHRQTRKIKTPLLFHTDACQAGAYLDLHAHRLGVDMMTLNGGKIYGPKQSGTLFIKAGLRIEPQILGGGQEHGLRSGTENVAGIVGFGEALALAQNDRQTEVQRLRQLQALFVRLIGEQIPRAVLNGSIKHRLPNNVHITIPGYDNERLLIQLEEQGILAAAGSACSASNEEPSHVLRAMGIGKTSAQASLRFSMGRSTTPKDVVTTAKILASCL